MGRATTGLVLRGLTAHAVPTLVAALTPTAVPGLTRDPASSFNAAIESGTPGQARGDEGRRVREASFVTQLDQQKD